MKLMASYSQVCKPTASCSTAENFLHLSVHQAISTRFLELHTWPIDLAIVTWLAACTCCALKSMWRGLVHAMAFVQTNTAHGLIPTVVLRKCEIGFKQFACLQIKLGPELLEDWNECLLQNAYLKSFGKAALLALTQLLLCLPVNVVLPFSPSLLVVSLGALSRKLCLQGEWLSPRVINLSLQYLTHGLTLSATWKHMKQHINALLTRCVLPLMCFNDEDDELWREDPQEYIRKVVWIDAISQQHECCCCLNLCRAVLLLCSPGRLQTQRVCVTSQISDETESGKVSICACALLSHGTQVVCLRHGLCRNRDMTSLRTCTVPRRQPPILFKNCAGVEPKKTWRPCCSL